MNGIRRSIGVTIVMSLATVGSAPVAMAAAKTGGGTACTRRCTPDTTPPTVTIASPTAGAAVSGTVTVSGTATDNVSVASVVISIDSGAWQAVNGTSSWSWSWDTSSVVNGNHTLAVRATDGSGNTSSAGVTVGVTNTGPGAPASISISTPTAGSSVAGTVTVAGQASGSYPISQVQIQVDGGTWQVASGSGTWSTSIDTVSYTNATHSLTARSTDSAGNVTSISESVRFANSTTTSFTNGDVTGTNTSLVDPAATNVLTPDGRGKQAEWGSVTVVLYSQAYTNQHSGFFRDVVSGATSFVSLPVDTPSGWMNANYAMASATDLWTESGDGPIYVRHYSLSGSPVPTSATLVSSQTFGDADSRHGDITGLASGGLVVVWHQQGASGGQGQSVAYRSPAGTWQVVGPLQFMPTASSKQVVAQHPADGSIWLFSNPDGYTSIGVAHLTETPAGLGLDWTNPTYVSDTEYGDSGPDLENPDLAVAPDPSTGTLALAYQDAHRLIFSTSPSVVTGSYVTVARISSNAALSFISLPVYVERVSSLGLVVAPGQTWLMYRPINQATLTFGDLFADCFCSGAWRSAANVGTLSSPYERVGYGSSRVEFSARMADGTLHFFTAR